MAVWSVGQMVEMRVSLLVGVTAVRKAYLKVGQMVVRRGNMLVG